jgi:hypothetical protein
MKRIGQARTDAKEKAACASPSEAAPFKDYIRSNQRLDLSSTVQVAIRV